MEYFGNTVLFVLCGLFAYESCSKVAWADFGWLLLLYILATLARGFMVAVLWPAVNLVGGSDVTLLAGKAELSYRKRCTDEFAIKAPLSAEEDDLEGMRRSKPSLTVH